MRHQVQQLARSARRSGINPIIVATAVARQATNEAIAPTAAAVVTPGQAAKLRRVRRKSRKKARVAKRKRVKRARSSKSKKSKALKLRKARLALANQVTRMARQIQSLTKKFRATKNAKQKASMKAQITTLRKKLASIREKLNKARSLNGLGDWSDANDGLGFFDSIIRGVTDLLGGRKDEKNSREARRELERQRDEDRREIARLQADLTAQQRSNDSTKWVLPAVAIGAGALLLMKKR